MLLRRAVAGFTGNNLEVQARTRTEFDGVPISFSTTVGARTLTDIVNTVPTVPYYGR